MFWYWVLFSLVVAAVVLLLALVKSQSMDLTKVEREEKRLAEKVQRLVDEAAEYRKDKAELERKVKVKNEAIIGYQESIDRYRATIKKNQADIEDIFMSLDTIRELSERRATEAEIAMRQTGA